MIERERINETCIRRNGLGTLHQTYKWLHMTPELHDHLVELEGTDCRGFKQ